jgi:hypothetical protein
MAQITSVTSEALQKQIRDLLPSQQGFGEDLQASNVIQPIIDLTAAAQGTTTGQNLQTALSFGSSTGFQSLASTVALMNTPGFWQITATASAMAANGAVCECTIRMSDGLSTKNVWKLGVSGNGGAQGASVLCNLVIFLRAGDSVSAITLGGGYLTGSYRQIADVNGNLVNPVGYTPQ